MTTLIDWLAGEAEFGAEACRKAEAEAKDSQFWRRYWAGYLKAFETMRDKCRKRAETESELLGRAVKELRQMKANGELGGSYVSEIARNERIDSIIREFAEMEKGN